MFQLLDLCSPGHEHCLNICFEDVLCCLVSININFKDRVKEGEEKRRGDKGGDAAGDLNLCQ